MKFLSQQVEGQALSQDKSTGFTGQLLWEAARQPSGVGHFHFRAGYTPLRVLPLVTEHCHMTFLLESFQHT